MRISVIGAGPAGTHAAALLAGQGHKVDVYEEHSRIGEPVSCTGILTKQIERFVDTRRVRVNTVERARIIAGKKHVEVKLGGGNLVVDRAALDRKLAETCEKAGAKIHTRHRFESNTGKTATIKDVKSGKVTTQETDLIIGADGPSSSVAKANSLYNNRRWWIGMQARAQCENDGAVEFYPTVGTYAWVVPEGDGTARVGICARDNAKEAFDQFCRWRRIGTVHSTQAGLIPQYDPGVKTEAGMVRLVGDAATQVKATTGGGIIQALTAAETLAESVCSNTSYERAWRERLSRDLWIHLRLRQAMDRFKPEDWEKLIRLFEQDRLKKILETNDRESPRRFLMSMILKEPRLLCFARYMF